jgi:urea carboxylase
VIEECPSPFVTKHPELREKLGAAAVRLAQSIKYGSAGTIEYLVDDETADFFFLEMNTRLQVEHGITEMCYKVDLVELMLKQADAQLQGKGGLDELYLESLQPKKPEGAAIEARVYAENPAKDYAPSPGTLQSVQWNDIKGSRIDTWVHTGSKVTSNYDPLLAKVMFHGATRENAIKGITEILTGSRICGPPTNLEFLATILQDPDFKSGNTMTKFLSSFKFAPSAIDVVAGGAYTLIEDYPGRPTIGRGFSHSGPMDPLAFRIANFLVGNAAGTEGLEITLSGPDLKFLGAAIVALCGAPMEAKLDGKPFPMWTRVKINPGQRLTIGKTTAGGCRSYLAVYGGFPSVAEWFGSKSTAPMTAVGGYQGRALASGDFLGLVSDLQEIKDDVELRLPDHLTPQYPEHWELFSMVGAYDEGYLKQEDIDMLYVTTRAI